MTATPSTSTLHPTTPHAASADAAAHMGASSAAQAESFAGSARQRQFAAGVQNLLRSPWLKPLNDAAALNDLLEQVNPLWSVDRIKARVIAVIDETADAKTFVLRPNWLWNGHAAGQNVGIELEINGVRCRRSYTLSSAPGGRDVTITVKRQPGGKVSNWLHDHVTTGDVLALTPARGAFTLPQNTGKLLMLSAGSGITPVMAMLRALHADGYSSDIVFVHSCRGADDQIFGDELRRLAAAMPNLRLELHDSRSGRLDAQRIAALAPDYAQRHALLCGPDGFMEAVREFWRAQGIESQLSNEHFTAARLKRAPGATVQAQVAFARSERVFDSNGAAPLLDEAERAGLKPQYGCRVGICHTCKCKKVSGTVENLLTGQVSSEPDEMIQLCVSAARSDLTLDL